MLMIQALLKMIWANSIIIQACNFQSTTTHCIQYKDGLH